jgi:hypothetical protein
MIMTEQISEKGIEFALRILTASGDLPEPTDNPIETHIRLIAACEKYIETSKARADVRTEQEERDCLLVYYFQAYLQDIVSTVN